MIEIKIGQIISRNVGRDCKFDNVTHVVFSDNGESVVAEFTGDGHRFRETILEGEDYKKIGEYTQAKIEKRLKDFLTK